MEKKLIYYLRMCFVISDILIQTKSIEIINLQDTYAFTANEKLSAKNF